MNGKTIYELGFKADPLNDIILVDGKLISLEAKRKLYFLFNKPRGCVCTTSDPQGRPTVMDYFSEVSERIYPVGRLDYASEGLLIFTNDGDVAHKLMHPSSNIPRTYAVKVRGRLDEHFLERLRRGIQLDGALITPTKVSRGRSLENKEWIYLTIMEGKNLEVRRIFALLGYEVERLRRIAIGPVELTGLGVGKYRTLSPKEIQDILLGREGLKRERAARAPKKRKLIPHSSRRGF